MRAGTVEEVCRDSGRWLFVDVGFSRDKRTSGVLHHDGAPKEIDFSSLLSEVVEECQIGGAPLDLLIEAPLSVAFTAHGNPSGRSVEVGNDSQRRYWYAGLGCGVMVAAMHLVRAIRDSEPKREIRLFEGFASFKQKTQKSSHALDVCRLRDAAWSDTMRSSAVVGPSGLRQHKDDELGSAFRAIGLDLGVPPVVVAQ